MLNNYGLGINLFVKDQMTTVFDKVGGKYTSMKNMFKNGGAQIKGYFYSLKEKFHNFSNGAIKGIGGINTAILSNIVQYGPWGVAIGVGVLAFKKLITTIRESIKISEAFEEKMSNIATLLSGNVEKKIDSLTKSIEASQIKYGQASDIMQDGTYQIISAFGETADIAKLLEIHTKSATAGMSTLTEATNLLSAVSKGYGDVSAENQQKISDLAFMTVKLGQTTFPELAGSIGRVVPLASTLNIGMEELFGTFATLTGVTGSSAEVSTQMASILSAMIKPTKELTTLVNSLGYESSIAMVKQEGMYGTLEKLWNAVGKNEQAFGDLIGRREALVAAFALLGGQADVFKQKLDAMKNSIGATDEAFQKIAMTSAFARKQKEQADAVFKQQLGRMFIPAQKSWYNFQTFILLEIIKFMHTFKQSYVSPMSKIFKPYISVIGVYLKGVLKYMMFFGKMALRVNGFLIKYFLFPLRLIGGIIEGIFSGFKKGFDIINPKTSKFKDILGKVSDSLRKIREAFNTAFGYGEGEGFNLVKMVGDLITNVIVGGFKILAFILDKIAKFVGLICKGIKLVKTGTLDAITSIVNLSGKILKGFLYPIMKAMEYLKILKEGTADNFIKTHFDKPKPEVDDKTKIPKNPPYPTEDKNVRFSEDDIDKLSNKILEGAKNGTKEGTIEGMREFKNDPQKGWEYDFLIRHFIPVY